METGKPCGRAGCLCTHTEPCDKGWIEEEYLTPELAEIPAEERRPGGPMVYETGGTTTSVRVKRCPVCAPPAAVPAKRYGPPEPDRQYAEPENKTPGWEGHRADLD